MTPWRTLSKLVRRVNYLRDNRPDVVIVGVSMAAVLSAALFDWRAGLAVAAVMLLARVVIGSPSLRRYQQAFENSPNAIFSVDHSGRIVTWNQACVTTFEYGAEIIGEHYERLLAEPADRLNVSKMLDAVFQQREWFSNIDLCYRTRQGDLHQMVSRLYPLIDPDGRVTECVFANTEVTERKRMEAALRESEERFRLIADNVAEVFYIIDPAADQLIYVSPAFERLWGRPLEDIYDKPMRFLETVHPDDVEPILQGLRSQEDHEVELRLIPAGQNVRWIRMRNRYLRDDAGQVTRIIGIAEDITARKQADQLVLERERIRMLANFVRDASHEFRTPLSIINTKLYLIAHVDDPDCTRQLMADINHQVDQIDRLLESLVLMARLDSGIAFEQQPVDLNTLLRHVIDRARPAAGKNSLALTFAPDTALPAVVGDAELLGQAFECLLDNSLRYTPAGGQITVRAFRQDGQVHIEFEDTGSGIEAHHLPHVFERFYRSDTAHSTRGFGLGLSIAQRVVEGHGGQIDVRSSVGEGSCFCVILPLSNGSTKEPQSTL